MRRSKINIDLLSKETSLSLEEIAKLAGISETRNLGKWNQEKSKGGSRPNFNALVKLLKSGASTETLFGVTTNKITPPHNTAGSISMIELSKFFSEIARSLEQPIQKL